MPEPTTTVLSGSSVIFIGIPSSSAIFLSSCFRIDPPPVSQAPSLSISETRAGGVLDSEILIASIIFYLHSFKEFMELT